MPIDLDPKAVRFIIDAITVKIAALQAEQKANPDNEDINADASNDIAYYRCIIDDMKR
jgi:hypothetical protein